MSRRRWSGETAREARIAAGLKPEEVATATSTHRATVYGWEAGREPQMRHALALADLYGISIDSLFVHDAEAFTGPAGDAHEDQESPGNLSAGVGAS